MAAGMNTAPSPSPPRGDHNLSGLLLRRCGPGCSEFFDTTVAGAEQGSDENSMLMLANAVRAKVGAVEDRGLPTVTRPAWGGTACSTRAGCRLVSMRANRCNYGRLAMQRAYEDVNIGVHALGVVISTLCGCVFVGGAAECLLQSVPAVCTFPYSVYSQAFSTSVQLWEGVKAATRTCLIHGSAAVSS
eukprot:CAMPEP_0176245392 /NCGR_PEP_ID=MMETSP0121_2-20121125/31919_1 /TAXON_ID=160619 /ORGANISM="Kryptoperidinium foliaceum, Strain CCMP 1326" /LENGTH=187 /DNA_ID=CAMNT_0017585021 /DNA_START=12 /DNA_END=575 /DNA_ORIENTATION=-